MAQMGQLNLRAQVKPLNGPSIAQIQRECSAI
jgi:hypothetical protein